MGAQRGYNVLRRHVGHRGAALLFFGALDEIYALSMVTSSDAVIRGNATYRWFATVGPLGAWALLWAVVGALCLWHAFQHHDRLGFVAAIGIKVLWGLGSLAGWAVEDVSLGSVAIWLGLAGLVWIIAGWPEPEVTSKDVES